MTEKKMISTTLKTKAIAKVDSNLPVAQWDTAKWNQIKKMFIPKGVSDDDAVLFMELSKAYDLNPFKREVWIVPFGNKAQVFCGRDGFLSIAHKTSQFSGMETDFGYNKQGNLLWAETTVWNKSCEHPVKCKVFLKEYTTGRNLWSTKPHVMLQKVAESSALRRAFNISGLYSPEEIRDEGKAGTPRDGQNLLTHKPCPEPDPITDEPDVVQDEPPKGNFNEAIKAIEGIWDISRLERLRKALNTRTWNPEEAKFLIDAAVKQEEKIAAQAQED